MSVESYKHKFAKNLLADWLREAARLACEPNGSEYVVYSPISWRVNRGKPHYGVWIEYPFALTDTNIILGQDPVWDEYPFWGADDAPYKFAPPTYDDCIKQGLLPIAVLDVAIQHKGIISHGFEVVYKNPVSDLKKDYLRRIDAKVYQIDADWILSRVERPTWLKATRV